MTDLTPKKSLTAAVLGIALLAAACGGGDDSTLGPSTSVPTSQFESAPEIVAARQAPPAQVTLDEVLAEVDQALADIDAALAATEDNR